MLPDRRSRQFLRPFAQGRQDPAFHFGDGYARSSHADTERGDCAPVAAEHGYPDRAQPDLQLLIDERIAVRAHRFERAAQSFFRNDRVRRVLNQLGAIEIGVERLSNVTCLMAGVRRRTQTLAVQETPGTT